MTTNPSERRLAEAASSTFLRLWALSNPHRKAGKEIADLVVAFGDDLIVFSDKASRFAPDNLSLGWQRWRKRSIDASLVQLAGAARALRGKDEVFVDVEASRQVPFELPVASRRRLTLVAVVRPDHTPSVLPENWKPLRYADRSSGELRPFEVGRCFAARDFVHVFDGVAIELLLAQLDTAPDFIAYLHSRERALLSRRNVTFLEQDLLAVAMRSWRHGRGYTIDMPDPEGDTMTTIAEGQWDHYASSPDAADTKARNQNSYTIDRLIDHFHTEHETGRIDYTQTYSEMEQAMRRLSTLTSFTPLLSLIFV